MNIFFMNSMSVNNWGGGEKWMLMSAMGLRERGHQIFFGGRENSVFLQKCREEGFPVFPLKIGSDFGIINIIKLARFFKEHHIDTVVANYNKDIRLTGLASWFSGNPILVARSGLAILPNNWRYRLTYKFLVDGIMTNTMAIKQKYLSYQWLDSDYIRVIYNGIATNIPVDFDKQAIQNKFDLPDQRPVIGIFGRLVNQKQHTVFLEVAKNISKELPKAIFLIVGDGPLRKDIQQYAFDLGILDSLYLIGFQKDVDELYAYCDLILLTSEVEGLPNVVIEAMLAGKPVVAFDVGGVKELIRSEKTGTAVPPNDIFLMTQQSLKLLKSPELRISVGKEAREFILENFSLDTMISEIELYFNELHHQQKK